MNGEGSLALIITQFELIFFQGSFSSFFTSDYPLNFPLGISFLTTPLVTMFEVLAEAGRSILTTVRLAGEEGRDVRETEFPSAGKVKRTMID